MSAIRSKNTGPELELRKILFAAGFRYRLFSKKVPGHPDLWLKKYHTAVFVHGCFWHRHQGCKYAYTPKSRTEFWQKKFQRNIERDAEVRRQLEEQHIRCFVVWTCTLEQAARTPDGRAALLNAFQNFLADNSLYQEY